MAEVLGYPGAREWVAGVCVWVEAGVDSWSVILKRGCPVHRVSTEDIMS